MTTSLAISPGTMMQLKTIAKEEGTTPQDLGEKAIRRYWRHEMRRKFQREEDAYRAMHADLLNTCLGQWVAVHRGQLVDRDTEVKVGKGGIIAPNMAHFALMDSGADGTLVPIDLLEQVGARQVGTARIRGILGQSQ